MKNSEAILQGLVRYANTGQVVTLDDRQDVLRKLADALFEEEDSVQMEVCLKLLLHVEQMLPLRREILATERALVAQKDLFQSKLNDLKNACGHPCTLYYPDASGNNDSTTVCLICGKEW